MFFPTWIARPNTDDILLPGVNVFADAIIALLISWIVFFICFYFVTHPSQPVLQSSSMMATALADCDTAGTLWMLHLSGLHHCYHTYIICLISINYLICDTIVGACIPGNEVGHQPLDPATLLGAEVLSWQPHIPVWAGPEHGEEGHQVTSPVHRKLCWWSRSPGDGGWQCKEKTKRNKQRT